MRCMNYQAKCPICRTQKHRTEMQSAMDALRLAEAKLHAHFRLKDAELYGAFVDNDFEWACDACLQNGLAIPANAGAQVYTWYAHLAYGNTELTCFSCGNDFVFNKVEKQLWYEKLKLINTSVPNNCLACRKQIRQHKQENTLLSQLLSKKKTELTREELETIISIYEGWRKEEKAAFYRAILRKLTH